jgi:hypothetical protein
MFFERAEETEFTIELKNLAMTAAGRPSSPPTVALWLSDPVARGDRSGRLTSAESSRRGSSCE